MPRTKLNDAESAWRPWTPSDEAEKTRKRSYWEKLKADVSTAYLLAVSLSTNLGSRPFGVLKMLGIDPYSAVANRLIASYRLRS